MSDMPLPCTEQKRRKGGQPGNLNALKHSFYMNHAAFRGAAPLKSADLDSVSTAITVIRELIRRTGESDLTTATLEEVSEATRSLAFAGLALARLIRIQQFVTVSRQPLFHQGSPRA